MIPGYVNQESLVIADGISMRFGSNLVLRNISFDIHKIHRTDCQVQQGQVVVLLGGSGCGKTTLARILAGLQQPTTGKVKIGPAHLPVEAGKVGMVWQNYRLLEWLDVEGNVRLACNRVGLYGSAARLRTQEVLEFVGMAEHGKKYPGQLSGGERQRVAIVQQVACSQHYLVLDEPSSGLDAKNKERVCDLIIRISQLTEESTLFVISHDIPRALRMGDMAVVFGHEAEGESGRAIPGSIIKKTYDLAQMGLAWRGIEIYDNPDYVALCKELEVMIRTDPS